MKNIKSIHLESIDSTNNYARDFVLQQHRVNSESKDTGTTSPQLLPLLVSADQQTAGRGRYGHSFLSPSGAGIYMSYAYERAYTEEELLGVTTRVAELLLPVLQKHYSGKAPLQIKPINDIYIGDPKSPDSRKIAGILTERIDYPDRSGYFIIVGIGINCTRFEVPDDLRQIIGFLEPDCSKDILIEEITKELSKL